MPRIHTIIVAAGSGTRFGGPLPKQFLPLCGIPVAIMTVQALRDALPEARDTIVLAANNVDLWLELCEKHNFKSPEIAIGGATRFESVRNSLKSVQPDTEIVLVHDAARPLVTKEMVQRLIDPLCLSQYQGTLPTTPLSDSIRIIKGEDGLSRSVSRSDYCAVQTPQVFLAPLLTKTYGNLSYSPHFTDDASVMESTGACNIGLVEGDPYNIKITNPIDLEIAETILKYRNRL